MFAKNRERVSYAVRSTAKSPYAEEWHNKGIECFCICLTTERKGNIIWDIAEEVGRC